MRDSMPLQRALWHRRRVDIEALTAQLREHGLDIVHAFPARSVATEAGLDWLHDDARDVGVLVGNSRALWEHFAASRGVDAELAAAPHPIEHYVEHALAASAPGARVIYAHATYDGVYRPFQRLAVAAGLAALAPSQLLIHPVYGPWFAVRAVLLVAGEPPPATPRIVQPCDCAEHGCVPLFQAACTRPNDWRAWLAVRDACPVGRSYRYSERQLAYHYTKDRQYLP
jgi:cyanocobalamin reductase (cyanide-eliminating) / alkylcobalamin dealkylase